jgi:putative zinc finger protein
VTGCDEIRHDLGGYVLGALEPAEAAAIRAHIDRCPECAGEHASLLDLPGLLDLAQGIDAAAGPAPAVEERLLDRVARTSRIGAARTWRRFLRFPANRRRPLAMAAIGLACAALGGAVAAVTVGGGDDQLQSPPSYTVMLKGTAASPRANARAALESVPGGTTVLLWVNGLPGDSDTVYEVLCEKGNQSSSAGTFRVDRDGQASITLTTAARRGQYDRIRVVRHGWDAATQRATETNVMTGQLF